MAVRLGAIGQVCTRFGQRLFENGVAFAAVEDKGCCHRDRDADDSIPAVHLAT